MAVRAESISYVKTHLAQVVEDVQRGRANPGDPKRQPGPRSFQDRKLPANPRRLAMLKLVAMAKHDIGHGRHHTHEDVFAAASQRLRQQPRRADVKKGETRLVWSDQAAQDLFEIVDYIASDSNKKAEPNPSSPARTGWTLVAFPKAAALSRVIHQGIATIREIIVKPWRIIYEWTNGQRGRGA